MQYCNGVAVVGKLLSVVACVALLLGGAPARAQDEGNRIEVMICPDVGMSNLTIIRPQSDSVVSSPNVVITGDVAYISQIDFFIDGTYGHTLALGQADTSFESNLALSPGTHTIKLAASDSCSQTTHDGSLVLTYEPAITPSVGEDVSTEIEGTTTNTAEVVDESVVEKGIVERAIEQYIAPSLVAFGTMLDLSPPPGVTSVMTPANVARSTLFITGTTLIMSAIYVSVFAVVPPKLSFLLHFRGRTFIGIAISGLALMGLVFIV
jgi:hypothetical protein